jgi:hypothetical protein
VQSVPSDSGIPEADLDPEDRLELSLDAIEIVGD